MPIITARLKPSVRPTSTRSDRGADALQHAHVEAAGLDPGHDLRGVEVLRLLVEVRQEHVGRRQELGIDPAERPGQLPDAGEQTDRGDPPAELRADLGEPVPAEDVAAGAGDGTFGCIARTASPRR